MKLSNKIVAAVSIVTVSTVLATQQNVSLAKSEIAAEYDAPVSLDLNFVYHIDADLAEQDVFIEHKKGSGKVYRVTKADRDLSAPLFRTRNSIEHNPFDDGHNGPFKKGKSLDMTLEEWFAAKGHGSYTCVNGKANIDVEFTQLVPNSVYTMWHFFMANPPTKPFVGTHDIPIGSRDGSQSVFNTDAEGNAHFQREFSPCLQLTGEHLAAGLAIAWHSDGNTYGPLPGEFATKSHVHLFLGLPKRSGL